MKKRKLKGVIIMASKIDELRKLHADKALDADELDNIAGGTTVQCAADSRFLNVLLGGDVCDRYGDYNAGMHYAEIGAAWERVGVRIEYTTSMYKCTSIYETDSKRCYYIGDKEVSAQEAYAHAMKVTGRYLTPAQWNW